ncbi:MAG: hypothetical protein JXB26_00025 [Candidatus Aminicenantes bacterium]|nr:hypothetical protein [Candidatus Aminicenantes bacterium]
MKRIPFRPISRHAVLISLCLFLFSCGSTPIQKPGVQPAASTLELSRTNIITAQDYGISGTSLCGGGLLYGWNCASDVCENIWTARSFKFEAMDMADIDGDYKREIIGLAGCRMSEYKDKGTEEFYTYFLCVYKEDETKDCDGMGMWRTTYGDGMKNNLRENTLWCWWPKELIIENMDGDDGDEVILSTGHWLAVYKYMPDEIYDPRKTKGLFKKHVSLQPSVSKQHLRINSIAAGNVLDPTNKMIVVSANREDCKTNMAGLIERSVKNEGYILFFYLRGGRLEMSAELPINAYLTGCSLRLGDIDGDENLEIISTGFKYQKDTCQAYIFIWDFISSWECFEIPIGSPEPCLPLNQKNPDKSNSPWNHVAVGEILPEYPGCEIVYTLGNQMLVTLCRWTGGSNLEILQQATLYDYLSVQPNNIIVADTDENGINEIIVFGSGKSNPDSGRFYLEIFNGNLIRKWLRIGGAPNEFGVDCLSVG